MSTSVVLAKLRTIQYATLQVSGEPDLASRTSPDTDHKLYQFLIDRLPVSSLPLCTPFGKFPNTVNRQFCKTRRANRTYQVAANLGRRLVSSRGSSARPLCTHLDSELAFPKAVASRYQEVCTPSWHSARHGISAEAPRISGLPFRHPQEERESLRSPKFVTSADFANFAANVTAFLCVLPK